MLSDIVDEDTQLLEWKFADIQVIVSQSMKSTRY